MSNEKQTTEEPKCTHQELEINFKFIAVQVAADAYYRAIRLEAWCKECQEQMKFVGLVHIPTPNMLPVIPACADGGDVAILPVTPAASAVMVAMTAVTATEEDEEPTPPVNPLVN